MTPRILQPVVRHLAAIAWLSVGAGVWGAASATAEGLTSNTAMAAVLQTAAKADHVEQLEIGRSVENRPLWAMRFTSPTPAAEDETCVVLLVGQQHGDEPAGAEALIDLVAELAASPESLATGLDLWIVPRINPDGAAAQQRRNANDFDLNRDHVLLGQPETQALHRLAQKIRPHIAVDCHEFRRDTGDYLEQGWTEWPLIMMDAGNLPIMPETLYDAGVAVCEAVASPMNRQGFNYQRYIIGSAPTPGAHGELRHSTLDPDDCRNSLSAHGTLSFIIESGIHRTASDPQADLPERVAANRHLLDLLIDDPKLLAEARRVAEASRLEPMPGLIPTNTLWANLSPKLTDVYVVDAATGQTVAMTTPTVMHDRVVKSAVPTPDAYVVDAEAASTFAALLDAHNLAYATLDQPQTFGAEAVILERIEETYDAIYHRYAGRQVTAPLPASPTTFAAGSLLIDLQTLNPIDARRAALVLEPRQLFGLYQWPAFAEHLRADGTLPVFRVFTADAVRASSP